MAEVAAPTATSPYAPLRHRTFRWLWLGVMISVFGTFMQVVGAQWLFVDRPDAGRIVALVQAATTLPSLVLALPAGVLADSFDRRALLLGLQAYLLVVGLSLTGLAFAGEVTVAVLLVFTALLGASTALELPAWQSIVPTLLPRDQIGAATRLDMLGVNVARAAGPALAGLVIARAGVPWVFALNAVSVVGFGVALLLWRPPRRAAPRRERFLPAIRAGGNYVRRDPPTRRILLRTAAFVLPGTAVWALLPILANEQYGVGPGAYGVMFAVLGIGALLGVLLLGRVRTALPAERLLLVAALLVAAALAGTVATRSFVVGLALLVVIGFGWVAMVSTFNADLQLTLPDWVRARGLAVYVMTFLGSQTIVAPVWGLVSDGYGIATALRVAAAGVALSALAGLRWPVPTPDEDADPSPLAFWGEPSLVIPPSDVGDGPVVVSVTYVVQPEDEQPFREAMAGMRLSRLRSGATQWDLLRVGEEPNHWVELFRVPSWDEHQRQHDGRLTEQDRRIEEAALRWSDPPARAWHLLPPSTPG